MSRVVVLVVLLALAACERAPDWRSAETFDPRSIEERVGPVVSALRAGDPEVALAELERIASRPSPPPALAHYEGVALLDAGRLEEAVEAFDRELAERPGNGMAHALSAEALLTLGRLDPADEHLAAARHHAPDVAFVALLTGRLGLYRDDDALARSGFESYLTRDGFSPRAAEAHHALAQIATRQGRLEQAARHEERSGYLEEVSQFLNRYMAALADDPDDVSATLGVGMIYLSLFRELGGDPAQLERARSAFEAVVRLDPENVKAHFNLGFVHTARQDVEAAFAAYERTLQLDPMHAGARLNLGMLARRTDQPERALENLEIAVRDAVEASDRLRARLELGALLEDLGRREEALVQYRIALADFPDQASALQPRIDALTDGG